MKAEVAPSYRWLPALLGGTLALLTFLLYLPVRNHDFLNWDDRTYVVENDHVRGGITGQNLAWAFTQPHAANWHPLTWLSHMLDCQWFGLNAGAHHLVNAGLHALNAALLFLLLRTMTGALWRSAMVAAVFAWHPLRVESVAWVAERKDVLCAFFGLLALLAYAQYAQLKIRNGKSECAERLSTPHPALSPVAAERVKSARWSYGLALLFFALGLMSKPMLVTLPFVMLLLDFWPLNRVPRAEFRVSSWQPLVMEKLPFFALTTGSCVLTFLAQQKGGAVASMELLPFGVRLGNAVLAYGQYFVGFLWPAKLSPVYPLASNLDWLAVTAALAVLAGITGVCWRMRQRSAYSLVGWLWFLGALVPVIGIVQVGSQALADRYTYLPMIGLVLAAVWWLSELAVKLRVPLLVTTPAVLTVLGLLIWRTEAQLGYWKNTETLFRRTLGLHPESVQALNGLGGYLVESGRNAEGRVLLQKAVTLQPTFAEAWGALALASDNEGNYAAAIEQYEATLKVNPDHSSALNNLAWLRAACPEAEFRNGAEAVRLATRACELTRYQKPVFIGTLAAAQAEAGDFQNAIATAERATRLADELNLPATAARNRELIQLYRQGKAAHGVAPKQL